MSTNKKIYICNPYFYDVEPSPLLIAIRDRLRSKYDLDVEIDGNNIPIESFENNRYIIICSQESEEINKKIYISHGTIFSRLPSETKYRESLSKKLCSWLRKYEIIDMVGWINWDSKKLGDVLYQVQNLNVPEYAKQYLPIIEELVHLSFEHKHYRTSLSHAKDKYIYSQINPLHIMVNHNLNRMDVPAIICCYNYIFIGNDWDEPIDQIGQKFIK